LANTAKSTLVNDREREIIIKDIESIDMKSIENITADNKIKKIDSQAVLLKFVLE